MGCGLMFCTVTLPTKVVLSQHIIICEPQIAGRDKTRTTIEGKINLLTSLL